MPIPLCPGMRVDLSIRRDRGECTKTIFKCWIAHRLQTLMHGVIRSPPSDTAIIHSKDSGRIFFFGGSMFLIYCRPASIKAAGRDDATSLIAGGSTTTAVESLNCDDEITCSAPEISSYSSDERVYVTVKINPDRYTVNALPSDASQTIAFGPTSFVIRA